MESNKKKSALLYLDRGGFYFYEMGLPNMNSMGFLPTSVRDLDVVDIVSLESQIRTFVEGTKLSPGEITIVISPNIIFEKDILTTEVEKQKENTDKFLETIPFENVASTTIPIENGVKVIGINEELYLSIKNAFEKLGSSVESVLPYYSLGTDTFLLNNLTAENASILLKKVDRLKQFSLLQNKPKTPISSTTNTQGESLPKKNSMRLYAMLVIFAVLFSILGFMLLKK